MPELVGLTTDPIVWICPSRMFSVQVLRTLPSRSRKIAPGWPFTLVRLHDNADPDE